MSSQAELAPLDPRKAFRRLMEYDPWIFSITICKRDPKAQRHHRPLLYLFTRRAALLCALLHDRDYDGPITQQVRADFEKHGIDWRDPSHMPRVAHRLRRINFRGPRSSGKSTFADDGDAWDATVDPNITISIGSKSDPFAVKRIAAIGEIIKSPEYAFWFPDRVPDDLRTKVTEAAIWIKGRTRLGIPEATIEGRGINSQWTGNHYRKNRRDDIVGTESGEASLFDALRHMANIDPLHDETGWVQDVYLGTINGEQDDHTILADDDGVLTIVVPLETHPGGTNLENIYTDGEITMPEWFTRERVNEIKANARKNPTEGPIWLLQNYYMAAHKSGVAIFTNRMIERAQFEWVYDKKTKRELIRRPVKGKGKVDRKLLNPEDWFYLDLKTLPRTAFAIAIDQSVAEDSSSDKWAQVLVCVDWEGVYYALDSLADHGYSLLLSEIIPFDKGLGRDDVRKVSGLQPQYIGIDANATQGMTVDWIKRTDDFRSVARRVRELRASNERKEVNIRNWVQARMLTGEFYVNPLLIDWRSEALKYRPKKADGSRNKSPKDDQLDATWMAMTLARVPSSPQQLEEEDMDQAIGEYEDAKRRDPLTGVMNVDWSDSLPNWKVA